MFENDNLKESLTLLNNSDIVSDEIYKKLLENCFSVLITKEELHDINSFNSRRLDVIKEVYGALLKISAEFARNDYSNEQISIFLTGLIAPRVCLYQEYYVKNKMKLRIILGNIGTHLPHITDVKWKIDFVVKSSNLNECDGPVFRITLLTDVSNELDGKKIEEVNFTCDSRELQDLVYKLKDAVRHCQKIRLEH